jgi:hypothetical protein
MWELELRAFGHSIGHNTTTELDFGGNGRITNMILRKAGFDVPAKTSGRFHTFSRLEPFLQFKLYFSMLWFLIYQMNIAGLELF